MWHATYISGKQCSVVHTLQKTDDLPSREIVRLLVGEHPQTPLNSSNLELAARLADASFEKCFYVSLSIRKQDSGEVAAKRRRRVRPPVRSAAM